VRITYAPDADAVYIHLTTQPLTPGRTTIQAEMPPGTDGFIAMDSKDGRLVGIEIRPVIFTMTFSKLPTPNNPAAS
jgi:uncharacterized protein YuzE